MKVADLTMEELEALVRRKVDEALAERDKDQPELREDFIEEMEAALASDDPGVSAEEAAKRLNAYWRSELRRQDDEIRAGTARLVPFEQAMAEMLRPLD